MKFYLISGEASGDLHGANLIKALQQKHPEVQVRAWGGDQISSTGATLVKHYRDLAFMGFIEVVKNIRTIFSNISFCKKDIKKYEPDALILVDYPGFNLRIAKWAHRNKIKVIYYISPQLWAWHSARVKTIARYVDEMITILPFEKAFYDQYGVDVHYVGHPLTEHVSKFKSDNPKPSAQEKPILLIMPGSRNQEVKQMLPTMIKAAQDPLISNYHVIVSAVDTIDKELYEQVPRRFEVIYGNSYPLLNKANLAWVSSGTATLEAALFKVPQVVCYKGNTISYRIAKRLIKVPYISLVNLIAEREIVNELIQDQFTAEKLLIETVKMELNKMEIIENYEDAVIGRLDKTSASDNAAQIIMESLD